MCFFCESKKKFVILIIIFCSIVTIFNVFSLIFRSTSTKEFELIKELINNNSKNENLERKKIKFSSLFKKFKKIEISFLIIFFSFSIFLLSSAIFLYLIIIKKLKNFLLIIKIFFIQILIEILLILVFLIIKIFVFKTSKNSLEKKFFSSTNKFENRLIINFFIEFISMILEIIQMILTIKYFNNDSNKNFNIVHQAFYHKNKIYIKINKNNQIVLVKIDEKLIKPIQNEKNNNENIKKFEYKNKIYSIVSNNNKENNNNENNENFVELKNTENNNNKNKKNYKKYEIINNNSNQN